MTTRIFINGFGRIGRLVYRALVEANNPDLKIVGVNDTTDVESNAYLLKYDSTHGRFPYPIKIEGSSIDTGQGLVPFVSERDASKLPHAELGTDIVLECTGHYTDRDKAALHLQAGAKRVLISAPGKNADLTVVYGVNHDKLLPEHEIVSNASCTTNCLAPVASVLQQAVGITHGYMTTIHSYTGDQRLLDNAHKDPRRGRAAAESLVPTSTGAAKAVGLVLPELAGKLDGTAIRVPTPNVSLIDLTFVASQATSIDAINQAMQTASQGSMKGILETVDEPLVSIDFNHTSASSIFDVSQTQVIDGTLCRVLSWYDNEWGFSQRMVDTTVHMASLLKKAAAA